VRAVFEESRRRRATTRVTSGDGRPLRRFRWWQQFSRSLFLPPPARRRRSSDPVRGRCPADGDENGYDLADPCVDGRHHAASKAPAVFPRRRRPHRGGREHVRAPALRPRHAARSGAATRPGPGIRRGVPDSLRERPSGPESLRRPRVRGAARRRPGRRRPRARGHRWSRCSRTAQGRRGRPRAELLRLGELSHRRRFSRRRRSHLPTCAAEVTTARVRAPIRRTEPHSASGNSGGPAR
jgi:hypothetical protein